MIDGAFTVFIFGWVGGFAVGIVVASVARGLTWIAKRVISIW